MSAPALFREGRWIPMIFVAGFMVVLVANGTMIWAALSTFTGIHTKQPYVKGLDYNRTLQRVEDEARLGWTAEIGHEHGHISLVLHDRSGAPVTGARLNAVLVRPIEAARDTRLAFIETAAGRYEAALEEVAPGQWELRTTVEHSAGRYSLTRRMVLR